MITARLLGTATALGILLGIAGCAAGKIDYVHVDTSYNPQQFRMLPYTGPLRTQVSGNPFGISQSDFARRVDNAIQPSGAPRGVTQGPVIHLAFGPTQSDVHQACQASGSNGAGGIGPGGTINMVAALCNGGSGALTYLVASIEGITGPDDPRFERFLRQSTVQLFPKETDQSRDRRNDNCIFPSC